MAFRNLPSDSLLIISSLGHGKTHRDAASVQATHPIPAACGLYYFEVKIVSKGRDGYMGIGLSAQGVNMNRLPGNTSMCKYINRCILNEAELFQVGISNRMVIMVMMGIRFVRLGRASLMDLHLPPAMSSDVALILLITHVFIRKMDTILGLRLPIYL